MKKFTLTMMTLGLVATLGLAGCGKQEKKATTSSEKTEVTLPTKDRSGKEITLPKEATKIISLVPSTTEVIEDLGKEWPVRAAAASIRFVHHPATRLPAPRCARHFLPFRQT